ncbi:hypothetical protein [Hymenobacter sediminicola]|uniref:Plug domain-containing protein n=1 Tax=Hymenobacter sediminicola TaxID=2761579 RepID=A0A7G7W9N3_9BACT|nr:hypothetical protein [Hymenobacter sediminicola]QNH63076.1 hypothetical protein H4317_04505 [Hymenobacter sediminicola]
MTRSCHRFLFLLLGLCSLSLVGYAQETTTYSRPQGPIGDPIVVLNSTIIINGVLAEFTPKETSEIKSMTVYKGPDTQSSQDIAPHLKNIRGGLIDITADKRVRSQSFPQLGRQLGLKGPLTFALNGQPLDPQAVAALRIAPAAIGQIHLVQPTADAPQTRVDIWLVPPPKPDTSKYPPGTIFLR